jgi:hypothetical protein
MKRLRVSLCDNRIALMHDGKAEGLVGGWRGWVRSARTLSARPHNVRWPLVTRRPTEAARENLTFRRRYPLRAHSSCDSRIPRLILKVCSVSRSLGFRPRGVLRLARHLLSYSMIIWHQHLLTPSIDWVQRRTDPNSPSLGAGTVASASLSHLAAISRWMMRDPCSVASGSRLTFESRRGFPWA